MNGILNIRKEQDFTSNDVVAKLRGICHMKKIGHTGTLDPMATGVLPVCLGSATKLCDILADHDKVYETVLLLGKTSDTQDIWGTVESEGLVKCTEQEVVEAINSFVGEYDQLPPMYSAKKVNGQKLYDLARQGITVERKKSHVIIYDIEILSIDLPRVRMRVHCGKGTYIRTLCNDIGEKLMCGGLMEELKRLRVGQFEIDTAISLSEAETLMKAGKLEDNILPVDDVFSDLSSVVLPEILDGAVYNGNPIPLKKLRDSMKNISDNETEINNTVDINEFYDNQKIRIYDSKNVFLGVYEYIHGRRLLMPWKMFLPKD